jgi:hypothetical protein
LNFGGAVAKNTSVLHYAASHKRSVYEAAILSAIAREP